MFLFLLAFWFNSFLVAMLLKFKEFLSDDITGTFVLLIIVSDLLVQDEFVSSSDQLPTTISNLVQTWYNFTNRTGCHFIKVSRTDISPE